MTEATFGTAFQDLAAGITRLAGHDEQNLHGIAAALVELGPLFTSAGEALRSAITEDLPLPIRGKLREQIIHWAVIPELLAYGADARYVDRMTRLMDTDHLIVYADGSISGLDEEVARTRSTWPEIFRLRGLDSSRVG